MSDRAARPIAELKAAPYNPRKIGAEATAALTESLRRFGDVGGIVWNRKTGHVVSGHQRLAVLKAAGAEEWNLDGDSGWIEHPKTHQRFPVRIVEWDLTQEKAANLAANNPASAGEFTDGVDELLAGLREADAGMVDALALDGVLDQAGAAWGAKRAKTEQEVGIPEPAKVVSRPGDVWTLGDHKLLVGDSLQADETKEFLAGLQVAMVATDPPYAIYGSSTGVSVEIADDKMVRPFFEAVMRLAHQVVPVFGHAYVCCDWRSWPALFDAARRSGMTAKNLLVWDKGGSGMGSNYANCYELLGFFAKIPTQGVMSHRKGGQRTVLRPNIVRIPRARGEDHQHNAAKPVPLMVEVITNSSERGDWVLDPFCGSGTTIVACENTGRRCAAVEIEPKWADVSVLRWQRVTGKKAVHGATGKAFGA